MNFSDFTGTSSKIIHVQASFGKYIFICNDQCEYIIWRYDISNNDNIYYSMQTFLPLLKTTWLAKLMLTNCMFEDIERRPIFLQHDIGTKYVMYIHFHYTNHYLYVYKTISNCRKYGMIVVRKPSGAIYCQYFSPASNTSFPRVMDRFPRVIIISREL